ncbi:MAG: response regulator transcription factor [Chloroflexota bacterium]|nr:response regulator transcription factor [Chloroflexota bacterium]
MPRTERLLLVAPSLTAGHCLALAQDLRRFGVDVKVLASGGWEALRGALNGGEHPVRPPDAILLDLTRPESLETAEYVRHIDGAERGSPARPLLALVPLVRERLLDASALAALVDDFLVPPYRASEVLARLLVIRRRRAGTFSQCLRIGDLSIDMAARQARRPSSPEPLPLTPREFDLLACLAARPRQVFTRGMLLEHVWGGAYEGGRRTVDIHVRRLREKLPSPYNEWIETIRHVGYRLNEPKPAWPAERAGVCGRHPQVS